MKKILSIITLLLLSLLCAFGAVACTPPDDNSNDTPIPGLVFTLNADGESYSVKGDSFAQETLTIPSTWNKKPVTTIANNAFSYTNAIKTVVIGDNVTKIGAQAFERCYYISSVTIPASVETIGEKAFDSVGLTGNPPVFNIAEGLKNIENYAFANSKLASISFPSSLEKIGSNAFNNATNLQEITIPDKVTIIQANCFSGCSKLTTINFNPFVTEIKASAFAKCAKLSTINFAPNGALHTIGTSAFLDCDTLESVIIPDSVITIDSSAFGECNKLKDVTIGTGCKTIKEGAFSCNFDEYKGTSDIKEDEPLKSLTLQSHNGWGQGTGSNASLFFRDSSNPTINATHYINRAYFHWYRNVNADTNDGLTFTLNADQQSYSIESNSMINEVVYGDSIKSLYIPEFYKGLPVTVVKENAFKNRTNLEYIVISKNVKEIKPNAFLGCGATKTITFAPSSALTTIADNAFDGCGGITEIIIPDSVTSIGANAFNNCYLLEAATIGAGCNFIGANAFNNCNDLVSMTFVSPTGWFYSTEPTATTGTAFTMSQNAQEVATSYHQLKANNFIKQPN